MTDFTKLNPRGRYFGSVPYGNQVVYPYSFETNASGVPLNSNTTVALTAADTIKLGVIPRGTRLIDSIHFLSDAFTATATCKLGFAYVDGVDSTEVPQDADFFVAALDLNTVAITRKSNVAKPVTLPKDAYLVLDLDVATLAAAGRLDIEVFGEIPGAV